MGHSSVPGCVLPIKELHAPGIAAPAQPAVLCGSLARDGWVGDAQLPVGFPSHVDLPVMAAEAESLQADDIEGGVEASGEVWKLLPGVCVGGTVTLVGDDELWVGRLWIQTHLTGI